MINTPKNMKCTARVVAVAVAACVAIGLTGCGEPERAPGDWTDAETSAAAKNCYYEIGEELCLAGLDYAGLDRWMTRWLFVAEEG